MTLFQPPEPTAVDRPRRAARRPRATGDPCCDDWSHWVALGRPSDRHVVWLHHLAHGRVPFTEAWLADKAEVPEAEVARLCGLAREEGWLAAGAFGGAAGVEPVGRGRTWVGRLRTR
jgi:hypothetical protein